MNKNKIIVTEEQFNTLIECCGMGGGAYETPYNGVNAVISDKAKKTTDETIGGKKDKKKKSKSYKAIKEMFDNDEITFEDTKDTNNVVKSDEENEFIDADTLTTPFVIDDNKLTTRSEK